MQNYSNSTYRFAGRKYTFSAYLHVKTSPTSSNGKYLNNEDIIMFEYENTFNELYLKAEMVIIDKYGIVDNFIDKQFAYMTIQHIQHVQQHDGNVNIDMLSRTYKFQHDFLINNIEILDRKGHTFTYKISMVSANWLNCIANISYSNYSKEPVDICDLIKTMLVTNGLKIHKKSFDEIHSNVKLNYITNENDNVLSAVKFLLNKMYYFKDKAVSLKFVVYNETTHRYQLFDLTNDRMINGTTYVTISLFKTNSELQFQQQPTNIATVTKMPKQKSFMNIRNQDMHSYDYSKNQFSNAYIDTKSIVEFKNEKPKTSDQYVEKYSFIESELTYKQAGSYWNNDLNIYGEAAKVLNEDNALVLNVDADILRKPGAYVLVNVDRDDVGIAGTADQNKLEDIKNKYKGIEGLWIVGKARHIIAPSKGQYKQNLVLFRNFIQK